jgi:chromate transporter
MHDQAASAQAPTAQAPTFGQALAFWLKLGFISFGGPSGQIAIMHTELVERRRWIGERRFLHALNYCMVLPGPEAQQLATYLGWLMHKTAGGLAAGLLFVLPSLLILIGLSWVYIAYGHLSVVAGLFAGIKPAVTALLVQAMVRMAQRTLTQAWLAWLAGLACLAMVVLGAPFPLIIVLAAALGWWQTRGQALTSPHAQPPTPPAATPAVLADDSPPPAHARFSWANLGLVLACGGLLWLLPMALLSALWGWQHTLTHMAWFFTKAALLTFGGAYTVLPYVYQGAVSHYAWLTPGQMMDGLALGESTPGPLIMVVAFVGFVGGYVKALFGPEALFLAGCAAACLVTWFTFLPSFVFILAGAPLVESSQQSLKLSGPLRAITAAVVGVMAQLAVLFAWHTLWPQGWSGPLDVRAAMLTAAAAWALMRWQRPVIEVLAVCALSGWLLGLGQP